MAVRREALLACFDPKDFWFGQVEVPTIVQLVLLAEVIEITPRLIEQFEAACKGRKRTLENLRSLWNDSRTTGNSQSVSGKAR